MPQQPPRPLQETQRQLHDHAPTPAQRRWLKFFAAEWDGLEATSVSMKAWLQDLRLLQRFLSEEGRWPRHGPDQAAHEVHLVDWIRSQRRHYGIAGHRERGAGDCYRCDRLELLPGWSWEVREDQWEENLTSYRTHVQQTGSPPRHSGDPDEHRLAVWTANLRAQHRKGRLPAHRIREAEALPLWHW